MRQLLLVLLMGINGTTLLAQATNPGFSGPGADAHWLGAAKDGFGTSNSLTSRVWFTLTEGVLSEVYFPTLDVPNVQSLQLIVVTPEGKVETELENTTHSMTLLDNARSLSFRQQNTALNGEYTISKVYVTDPRRDTLLMHVSFKSQGNVSGYKLFVYYDPSLNNSGRHDSGWTEAGALLAVDADKASALLADPAFVETNNGFLGLNDSLTQMRSGKPLINYRRANNGNVVQVGRPGSRSSGYANTISFTLALGFGNKPGVALNNARASLRRGSASISQEYRAGWHAYTNKLPQVESPYQNQFNVAAMVLKGLEDKTHRGGMIASPSIPWGGGPNANEPTSSGYHAVWSRDLYQVATAFQAMGDRETARRALDYLFRVQQRPDGSFPQNSWLDGRPIGGAVQMDEVAFPIILAYQLGRTDRTSWLKHVKPAADYLVKNGPATQQERWEEKPGFSPSTIAAEIAGLVCAAEIARLQNDTGAERTYLETADFWARHVEQWTATTTGPLGDRNYYLRISENNNPNDGAKIEINSGGGSYDEREIVDAGFLELVRLGIKPAGDPLIRKSLAVLDEVIKVRTPVGEAWYRYNHDAYGEQPDGGPYDGRQGKGRLWALLSGERGEYELALGQTAQARNRLDAMRGFANDGLMIPEQVWDQPQAPKPSFRFGEGTGSATPLAWSMAQYIRLVLNIKSGRNLETPQVVAERYLGNRERTK
jgi:glucan 1,4-alpha-glucosidase